MWNFFVYFLIFLVPGLFGVLVYNLLCCRKMGCCKSMALALLFDLFILGMNFAGLRFIRGICTFKELQYSLTQLGFVSNYILLSLGVAVFLAIIACLLTRIYTWCRIRFYHSHKSGGKK